MVIVEDDPDETDGGANVAVAPVGSPRLVRVTDCATPAVVVVAIGVPVDWPATTVSPAVVGARVKLFVGVVQPGSRKLVLRVAQLNLPSAGRDSVAAQRVQSSTGSTVTLA